ncbi:MAG TPA: hypothetical protein VIY55_13845 [Acetobacteraceae bacterium]|jgi:hypothetical protein
MFWLQSILKWPEFIVHYSPPHEAMNRSHYNTPPLVSDWRGGRIDYDIVHMDAASALSEGFLGCVPRPTG